MTVEERNELFEKNVKLVYYTLAKFHPMFVNSEYAFQEGCIALLDAIENYDPEKGNFAPYAIHSIILRVHRKCYLPQKELKDEVPISNLLRENSVEDMDDDEYIFNLLGHTGDSVENDSVIKRMEIVDVLKHLLAGEAYMLYSLMYGKTQVELADEFRTTRQNISRRILLAMEKFKVFWNKQ